MPLRSNFSPVFRLAATRFLDGLKYKLTEGTYQSVETVVSKRVAHCLGAANTACLVCAHLGLQCAVLRLDTHLRSGGHAVCVWRFEDGDSTVYYGALGIGGEWLSAGWRDCVFRSIREVVVSMYDGMVDDFGNRCLSGYTVTAPWSCDSSGWLSSLQDLRQDLALDFVPFLKKEADPRFCRTENATEIVRVRASAAKKHQWRFATAFRRLRIAYNNKFTIPKAPRVCSPRHAA